MDEKAQTLEQRIASTTGIGEEGVERMVVFDLDGEEYGVPIGAVDEVLHVPPITSVPNAPECVLGIFHLHGKVVVAIDLERRFQLTRKQPFVPQYIVISHSGDTAFGVLVDKIKNVVRVEREDIQPPPAVYAGGPQSGYLIGVAMVREERAVPVRPGEPSIMIEPGQRKSIDGPHAEVAKMPHGPAQTEEVIRPVLLLDLKKLFDLSDIPGFQGEG
ncbi:MAG TPA: chemotaxis protein CheW [Candidatus Paceibacterota bacterium]|nr:chemotaxis protein CheW [Candidatus Paceibacterota bacterium]